MNMHHKPEPSTSLHFANTINLWGIRFLLLHIHCIGLFKIKYTSKYLSWYVSRIVIEGFNNPTRKLYVDS